MLFPKDKITNYKNCHKKERCFIVATGPSLNHTPLNLIENEIIFGVNGLYKHEFVKHCNYYCLTDAVVWRNHSQGIKSLKIPLFTNKCIPAKNKHFIHINISDKKHFSELTIEDFIRFDKATYLTGTVVGTCLMLAYYMGFYEVYLVGCDCNYPSNGRHHFDGSRVDNYYRTDWRPVFDNYRVIKQIYEKTGRKIYNATVGGKLEVFERKSLLQHAKIARNWKSFNFSKNSQQD